MQAERSAAITGQIEAVTDAGHKLVEIAEELAEEFALRSAEHDQAGTFPHENIEALKQLGFFAGAVPEELGGIGVESAHDLLVASSRLARGEPSTAIGVNMHMATVYPAALIWRRLHKAGHPEAEGLAGLLQMIAAGGVVIATPISERNQDILMPQVRGERVDGGWSITGNKIFGTMSPGATMLLSTVGMERDGQKRLSHVLIPKDAPGVVLHDDWDALGMRASGSVSVSYEGVVIPDDLVIDDLEYGKASDEYLEGYLIAGPLHATAPLGIAEQAHQTIVDSLHGKPANPRGITATERATTKLLAGENAIDLFVARAALQRSGRIVDEYFEGNPDAPGTVEELHTAYADSQAAKIFVGRAAQRIVDRALTMSGGAGFFNKHPLSRHYRDVRASGFMHPLSENIAPEYLGNVTLGLNPEWF